jgi:hypothetical protein
MDIASDDQKSSLTDKYNKINRVLEKIVERINYKIIQNLEQNMVIKFNLKEIIELNQNNNLTVRED